MAIKYISIPEKNTTIAILSDTAYAAVDRIQNVLGGTRALFFDPDKYMMKNSYKATVICRDGDEFSVERGKKEAKKKLMKNYYRALDRRIDAFIEDLNIAMFRVVAKCPTHDENKN